MNIRQAAHDSGLSTDTIRFYERERVLPRPPHQDNGYRRYTEDHVSILRLAKGLRDLGLPLAEVRGILAVAHDATCSDIRMTLMERLKQTRKDLDERIRGLTETSRHVESILDGLNQMQPSDERVPGIVSCQCLGLVQGPA